MKIHIDIPPENSVVQRLITETKMYKDKGARFRRAFHIRSIHSFFVMIMMFFFTLTVYSWEERRYWFGYTFSLTVDWIFSGCLATRVAWGIGASVVLIREWRALYTSASESEELKSLLEEGVDSQDKSKIQKHSLLLADERKFYTIRVRKICVMETLATFYLSGFLCMLVSMKLVCHGFISMWIFYLIGYGLIWIGCLNGIAVVLIFGGIILWNFWSKKHVASV